MPLPVKKMTEKQLRELLTKLNEKLEDGEATPEEADQISEISQALKSIDAVKGGKTLSWG